MNRFQYIVMSGITIFCFLGILTYLQPETEVNSNQKKKVTFKESLLDDFAYEEYEQKEKLKLDEDTTIYRHYLKFEAEVTAYTAGYQCTGKTPDHPQYGVTRSGRMVEEGVTLAAPEVFPFGTVIEIPGVGKRVNYDTGSAIKYRHDTGRFVFDIYVKTLAEARKWGREVLEVKVYTDNLTAEEIEAIKQYL